VGELVSLGQGHPQAFNLPCGGVGTVSLGKGHSQAFNLPCGGVGKSRTGSFSSLQPTLWGCW
jgi:hypothetical protein